MVIHFSFLAVILIASVLSEERIKTVPYVLFMKAKTLSHIDGTGQLYLDILHSLQQ